AAIGGPILFQLGQMRFVVATLGALDGVFNFCRGFEGLQLDRGLVLRAIELLDQVFEYLGIVRSERVPDTDLRRSGSAEGHAHGDGSGRPRKYARRLGGASIP